MSAEPDFLLPLTVDIERYCIRCGYLLHGLPMNGVCPECGTSVELSLREPTLAAASREYQRTTLRGLSLILNAIPLWIVLGAFVVAGLAIDSPELMLAASVAGVGVSLMSLLGYWRFSEPDLSEVAFEPTNAARKVIRVTVLVVLVITTLSALLEFVVLAGTSGVATVPPRVTELGMLSEIIRLASIIAWAIKFFAVMRYTRWFASRVPDQFIVNRTKTYMWLLPLLWIVGFCVLFLGPLIAYILYWNLLNRLRKHLKSIIADGQRAVLPKLDVPMPGDR